MKNLFYIFIVMLFPFFANAQEESHDEENQKEKKHLDIFHEIGINGTSLLSQFLNFSDKITPQSPYFLTYKIGAKKHALRFGAGATFKESEKSVETFDDTETIKDLTLDWRVGYEFRIKVGDRWLGYFGADFIYTQSDKEQINDSGFDVVTIGEYKSGIGGGPVIGLQFYLTPKLLLGTEGAFYFSEVESRSSTTFANFPEFNTEAEIVKDKELISTLPATIYLIFHF